ncbi:hypothetical protein AAMO2058_001553400 [Amorphochlora amoebiformis]
MRRYVSVWVVLGVMVALGLIGGVGGAVFSFCGAKRGGAYGRDLGRRGCSSKDDRNAITNRFDTLKYDVQSCATGCMLSGKECVTYCVERLGFSVGCARCWSDMTSCSISKCSFSCMNPWSSKCKKCTYDHCFPSLVHCAQLDEKDLPPH